MNEITSNLNFARIFKITGTNNIDSEYMDEIMVHALLLRCVMIFKRSDTFCEQLFKYDPTRSAFLFFFFFSFEFNDTD